MRIGFGLSLGRQQSAPLRPSQNDFDFTYPDSVVTYAQQHSLPLQVHHLVWGNVPTLPAWLKKGNFSKDDCSPLSRST